MKPISIIIPALNEQDYLPRLLQSFVDQDYDGEYEIIVVDGRSSDGTKQAVEAYQKVLPNLAFFKYKRGVSRQRNYGAKMARYDNLVFLDADMALPRKSLAKIEEHFQTKTNFIALPTLFPYDWTIADLLLWIGALIFIIAVRQKNPVIIGMCIVTTKQVHNRINGFNEDAVLAEDVDYGLRAHKSGARYYMLFNTIVRGSARRLEKMGRIRAGKMSQTWYYETIKNGAITDPDKYNYEFGAFKKD